MKKEKEERRKKFLFYFLFFFGDFLLQPKFATKINKIVKLFIFVNRSKIIKH